MSQHRWDGIQQILLVTGIVLTGVGLLMLVPAIVDALAENPDWEVFTASGAIVLFLGIALALANRTGHPFSLGRRDAFLLTATVWIAVAMAGAIPLAFAELGLDYADALFESVSGLTTTGSTVLIGLDTKPPGVLLWRALLQWMGGIGIIVMAVAILPFLRVGGMQLFQTESSDRSQKALPGITQIAISIGALYAALTALCALALLLAGMSVFDAITHAMTTLSTGGYSTRDHSIGHFDNLAIEIIIIVFMTIGGLTFSLIVAAALGRRRILLRDTQIQTYLLLLAAAIVVLALWRVAAGDADALTALRESAFSVTSIVTTTGFVTTDYGLWGPFAVAVFFMLMFVGGCTGSTSGAIKVFRWQILYQSAIRQVHAILSPHRVRLILYNGGEVNEDVISSVLSFLTLFFLGWIVLALGLSLFGLDFLTATSAAATAITNVGPGLGPIVGPAGTFATMPDGAKLLLSVGMLLGRLEIYTLVVLLFPAFWRD